MSGRGDVSAARPADLEAFATVTARLDREAIRPRLARLAAAAAVYRRTAPPDAPPLARLLGGAARHLERSGDLAAWVGEVALAFVEADAGRRARRDVVVVPTEALAAAIGTDLFETDPAEERRGRALGLTGIALARYVRGAELGAAALATTDRFGRDGMEAWAAVLPLYRDDADAARGFFDAVGPAGAVALVVDLHRAAGWHWLGPGPEVDYPVVVTTLSTMLGHHARSNGAGARGAFSQSLAAAVGGADAGHRLGVVTAYASAGSLPPAVLEPMLDTVLAAAGRPFALPLGGRQGWDWGSGLDLRDAQAVVLEAVDRSGAASAVLAADPAHAGRLLDPERLYSDRAAAALDRVLDRPRLDLLDHVGTNDVDAISAVVHLAVATGDHDGTVAEPAAAALARLTVAFPGEIAGAGTGFYADGLRSPLGQALAELPDPLAGVDLVAAARQADDPRDEWWQRGRWDLAIDATFTEHAADRFREALDLAVGGRELAYLPAARQAGEADMVRLASALRREANDGGALDDRDAMVSEVGGWVVDVATAPVKNPVTAVAAERVGEWVAGAVWSGGRVDQAVSAFQITVQGAAAVASVEAIQFAAATGQAPAWWAKPDLPSRLLQSEHGARVLATMSRALPPPVQAACTARTEAARRVLVGVRIATG